MVDKKSTKIDWHTTKILQVGPHGVPLALDLEEGNGQGAGVRYDSPLKLALKRVVWPAKKLHDKILVDGFIEREIGKLIEKYQRPGDTYLEVGCGDMKLSRFVPKGVYYNALDISFSEFHLRRVLAGAERINPVVATATSIPADTGSASLIFVTETFDCIPDINAALEEIRRVSSHNARLICSIPNGNCYKYAVKGDAPFTRHKWSFDEFVEFMSAYDFRYKVGFQKGYWIRMPFWLTDVSYHLPIRNSREDLNVNFFFVFDRE